MSSSRSYVAVGALKSGKEETIMSTPERFVREDGRTMDREMHPKVKKAQEEYARKMAELEERRKRQQRH